VLADSFPPDDGSAMDIAHHIETPSVRPA